MKKQFDLYKWIIIVSLVVMPLAGGWVYWLEQKIERGERAIALATRPRTGELYTIGRLLHEIEVLAKSAGTASDGSDPGVYFDRQIIQSSEGLRSTDYKIDPAGATPNPDSRSIDRIWKIEFKRDNKPLPLSRELIQAVLFNIEAHSPAWRLRSLHMRAEDVRQLQNRGANPPPEIGDNWTIDKMEFARREPDTSGRRK
ncbi:MAG TPA: hypothetical protein VK081_01870 [Planctomycetota bacterium]|nr:hypothetical protein [Planctomycetota bacterium]